jgi:transposase
VKRYVAALRQALQTEDPATLRFETGPGYQLQIDFGKMRVPFGGQVVKLHLFVATLA